MNSNDILPENAKEKQGRGCPYLGLQDDPQTSLFFPSTFNVCHHAKPLASPNLEYQRDFCLKGRQHTGCPVFTRSELAPLPPEIGAPTKKQFFGRPVEKRAFLLIMLGCVVLILGGLGGFWWTNGYLGGNGASPSGSGRLTPALNVIPLAADTFSVTDAPITPNYALSALPNTVSPSATTVETLMPQTPTPVGVTPVPYQTPVPCGAPRTWVTYIIQPGDSLYRLSQYYGVTVAALQSANCLGSSTVLHTGQILRVPPGAPYIPPPTVPVYVTQTKLPTNTPVPSLPSDTPTEPPTSTATEIPTATQIPTAIPIATDVPTDTPVSP